MSQERKVNAEYVRSHVETVLDSYEQVFEKFFLAKFMGLNFEYMPLEAADADKEFSRVTLTSMKP